MEKDYQSLRQSTSRQRFLVYMLLLAEAIMSASLSTQIPLLITTTSSSCSDYSSAYIRSLLECAYFFWKYVQYLLGLRCRQSWTEDSLSAWSNWNLGLLPFHGLCNISAWLGHIAIPGGMHGLSSFHFCSCDACRPKYAFRRGSANSITIASHIRMRWYWATSAINRQAAWRACTSWDLVSVACIEWSDCLCQFDSCHIFT